MFARRMRGVCGNRSASEADERPQQPAQGAVEARVALQSDKANAFGVGADDRLMIDVDIRFIQVTRMVSATFVEKGPRQHLQELRAAVSVRRELQASPPFEQHDLGIGAPGNGDFAPPETRPEPAPGADLAMTQRGGELQPDKAMMPGDERSRPGRRWRKVEPF